MKTLASRQAYEAAIKEGTVVVVFSAQWCADCRVIEPVLPEIEEKYSQLKFFQVDRDQLIDLVRSYIFGIPSFIIYRMVLRSTGLSAGSENPGGD